MISKDEIKKADVSRVSFMVLGTVSAILFGAILYMNFRDGQMNSTAIHLCGWLGLGFTSLMNMLELVRRSRASRER